jgi:hypothetical protein
LPSHGEAVTTLTRICHVRLFAVKMRAMTQALLLFFLSLVHPVQNLPQAFPRDGARQLINNDRVIVWEVMLEKDKPSPMHLHQYDMVGVYLDNFAVASAKKGSTDSQPGNRQTRAIFIELKDVKVPSLENKTMYPLAFPRYGGAKVLENDRFIVWDYTWTQNKATPMHFHDKDFVVVYIADGQLISTNPTGKMNAQEISIGLTRFNARGGSHTQELVKGSGRAIIFELK